MKSYLVQKLYFFGDFYEVGDIERTWRQRLNQSILKVERALSLVRHGFEYIQGLGLSRERGTKSCPSRPRLTCESIMV